MLKTPFSNYPFLRSFVCLLTHSGLLVRSFVRRSFVRSSVVRLFCSAQCVSLRYGRNANINGFNRSFQRRNNASFHTELPLIINNFSRDISLNLTESFYLGPEMLEMESHFALNSFNLFMFYFHSFFVLCCTSVVMKSSPRELKLGIRKQMKYKNSNIN